MFRYDASDTVERCYLNGIYFKDDSVVIVSTGDDYSYKYSKARLSEDSVRLLDTYLRRIQIDSVLGIESIKRSRDEHVLYCAADFGLVNIHDSLGVFDPVYFNKQRSNALDSLSHFVFSLKGNLTTDTIELVNSIHRIQKEYLTVYPPLKYEHVKFKPPVIIDHYSKNN